MINLLSAEQAYFDDKVFDPLDGYEPLNRRDKKVAHIGLHLGKIVGRKLLPWAEGFNPAVKLEMVRTEVLPDLCIYRSQLASVAGMTALEVAWETSRVWPIRAVTDGSSEALAFDYAAQALGNICDYLEPRQHGKATELTLVMRAVANLQESIHSTAEVLDLTDAEVTELHRARIDFQLAERGLFLPTAPTV